MFVSEHHSFVHVRRQGSGQGHPGTEWQAQRHGLPRSKARSSACCLRWTHLDCHLAGMDMLCSDKTITLTHNIMTIESKLPSSETSGDYTTTTTAAPTPTPCTFIALPEANPTSCLRRVNHHRTQWVLPPQSENTALHGYVNRQSHHDSQHGTHRSMRMYQTPSQGQGVEAIVQTSSTHSVMSVGLVERPNSSALLSKPSTTMLPATAARPVLITMLTFLTTSR